MTIKNKEIAEIIDVKIEKGGGECYVKGYQTYNIQNNRIFSEEIDTHEWANTQFKISLIRKYLRKLNIKNYLDFGCNLGALVFTGALENVNSTGMDYLEDYINVCKKVKDHLNISNSNFKCANFAIFKSNDLSTYDLTSFFNIHHHLWGRTENPQTLKEINNCIAKKSNYIIIEFPNEFDKKALKHMKQHPGIGEYSEIEFIKSFLPYKIELIRRYHKHRPIYLIYTKNRSLLNLCRNKLVIFKLFLKNIFIKIFNLFKKIKKKSKKIKP